MRVVDYHRAAASDTVQAQVNHTAHDPQGRANDLRDPRLFLEASSPANLSMTHSLSGAVLCSVSVDAGLRLRLFGEDGQPVHDWDGRGARRLMHYDAQRRLTTLFEQAQGGEAVCAERLSYAANDQAAADHNQCGRLILHDDPAGTLHFIHYALTGSVLAHRRHFTDAPLPGFTTSVRLNPLGESLSRTDAQGNEQQFAQSLAGHLRSVWLRLSDTTERRPIVAAIHYNAQDQVEKEVAGNGVVTTLEYCAQSGRLTRLVSRLEQHAPLQDLQYAYDPVGNVLSIEDAALPVRHFANQRIEPLNRYGYDSLYRLIDATGWEAGGVDHGPASRAGADPAMPGNYRQTYRYDRGNNLLELTHVGPQNHGHRLVADRHSNRCLPVRNGIEPTEQDFRDSFDANGNLRVLHPGQTLSWDLRNQLREVRPVERDSGPSDSEQYVYGADGQRVRKTRSLQTHAQSLLLETLYLPGLEIRTHSGTGEILHVIDVSTGRGSVRVLHWQAGKPDGIANDQQRYGLTDHLGSSTLELDQDGQVITQERYYPFGETAWSSGEAVQVSYKTVRYSGKERDATRLYYYGFRYYVPWLQRWVNPDPAGLVDGLNLYGMVRGNPLRYIDSNGLGLQSTNKKNDYVLEKKTQDITLSVDVFKRFFFSAKLSKARVKVLNEVSGDYESVDDFQVVEVGVGDRDELVRRNPKGAIATDEVRDTLQDYQQKYGALVSATEISWYEFTKWGGAAAKARGNFLAGQYISNAFQTWLVRGEQTRQMEVDGGRAPDNRLFALIRKSDLVKAPSDRRIYGLSLISLNRDDERPGNAELVVDFTIVDPAAQSLGGVLLNEPETFTQDVPKLRGAGTYLTMNAISQVGKTVNMQLIRTNAINPRSAAMALGWGEQMPF